MCILSHHDSELKCNTIDSIFTTNTSTNIIDNGQNDDATTRLDNQQTSQQELATELATVVPINIQEDF